MELGAAGIDVLSASPPITSAAWPIESWTPAAEATIENVATADPKAATVRNATTTKPAEIGALRRRVAPARRANGADPRPPPPDPEIHDGDEHERHPRPRA